MLSDFKERRHNSDDEKSHYELREVKRAIPNQHILLSVLIVIIAVILFSTAYASGDDPFEGMDMSLLSYKRIHYQPIRFLGRFKFIVGKKALQMSRDSIWKVDSADFISALTDFDGAIQ